MRLAVDAPAKVNLCLKVLGQRPDGYHDLFTVMQTLSLCDELLIESAGPGIAFSCSDPKLGTDDNLVLRAARAWCAAAGIKPALRLHLDKRIPVAAGLGGGSSDAAACLLGLNATHGRALEPGALVKIAASLGADVPFFLAGGSCLCQGIGEKVTLLDDFPLLDYVLVNPNLPVSTAWVYRQWDLAFTNPSQQPRMELSPTTESALEAILVNDLETVTITAFPQLGQIKQELLEVGALGSMMSGSGPTVFGIFDSRAAASAAARILTAKGKYWVVACRGIPDLVLG